MLVRASAFLYALLMMTMSGVACAEPRSLEAVPWSTSTRSRDQYRDLLRAAEGLRQADVRQQTLDALSPQACVRHRRHLSDVDKTAILQALIAAGLLPASTRADDDAVRDGVFPPVLAEGSDCPHLPQDVRLAAGGNTGSHHDWPGGLVAHESFNLRAGLALARLYARADGQPLDTDTLTAAILWHDWAKTLVLTWRADGTTYPELQVADTGVHHILGLAESMARGLPPEVVAAQACAHAAPTGENAAKVRGWIIAAGLIARVPPDAIARVQAALTPASGPSSACLLDNAADANWIYAEASVAAADQALRALAPEFGYDPAGTARYRRFYRNRVLNILGSDRIRSLWQSGGTDALRPVLLSLRRQKVI